MEPNRFGRRLGIGVRVASRMVKERAAQPAASAPPPPAARPATPPRPARNIVEPARRVGVGTRKFGEAFLGPLARVSRALWLEVTGLFFTLFALFFAQNAYKVRSDVVHGPEHAHFVLYCVFGLVFLYFAVSSFLKAARTGRQRSRAAR